MISHRWNCCKDLHHVQDVVNCTGWCTFLIQWDTYLGQKTAWDQVYVNQSWVECVGILILRHSVQLSSAELNIPSLFNSAELNAWVVLYSLLHSGALDAVSPEGQMRGSFFKYEI